MTPATATAAENAVRLRIAELTLRFMTGLPARVASIRSALARWEANAPGASEELERQLHSLAGTAATYGATEIGTLAAAAEAVCVSAKGTIDEQQSLSLRNLVAAIESSASAVHPPHPE